MRFQLARFIRAVVVRLGRIDFGTPELLAFVNKSASNHLKNQNLCHFIFEFVKVHNVPITLKPDGLYEEFSR